MNEKINRYQHWNDVELSEEDFKSASYNAATNNYYKENKWKDTKSQQRLKKNKWKFLRLNS